MDKSFLKSKSGQSTIKAICIIVSYIVLYGLLMLLMNVLQDSTPAFLVFLVVCMIFAHKSCKGVLANALGFLPWPVFFVFVILLSAVVGCFTAPYHIGKWISKKIIEYGKKTDKVTEQVNKRYSEESLKKMSDEELDALHLNLAVLVMPTFDEPETKCIPDGLQSYGCKTWGEARKLLDLVAEIYNERL